MSVTIKDVAKLAGVSPSTVSRVISDSDSISEKTKQRVRDIMKELKYFPNMNARSLVSKSSRIIGLVLPTTTDAFYQNPFFPTVLRGINDVSSTESYSLLLSTGDTEENRLNRIKTMVNGKQVDGLIFLYSKLNDGILAFLKEVDFPFVVIGTPEIKHINSVDNDNEAMSEILTHQLIKRGARQIAFVGGDTSQHFVNLRYQGYVNALRAHDLVIEPELVMNDFPFLIDEGYRLAEELAELPGLDAVVIADQLVARGIRSGWKKSQYPMILTATFKAYQSHSTSDDMEVYMDINAQELGRSAMRMLIDLLAEKEKEPKVQRYYEEIVDAVLIG